MLRSVLKPVINHTRFVCLSDTHNQHNYMPVPDGDVLIHTGDFTFTGHPHEVKAFNEFLGTLPHPIKIVIAGNHELTFDVERYPNLAKRFHRFPFHAQQTKALLTNALYLEDQAVEVNNIKIYGSPWQPKYKSAWAFNLAHGDHRKWDLIPSDTDILLTHGPAYGHGDLNTFGLAQGCRGLLKAIERTQPKYHIFGHIHEGYGVSRNQHTCFINASTCNRAYLPVNAPITFEM
jgi:hypothetical protein